MTQTYIDTHLTDLKQQLIDMAECVSQSIDIATKALQEGLTQKYNEVYSLEKKINAFHIAIDDHCIKLMALQHPLAIDLRFIVAVLKINTDLERMGDQAVNIAQNGDRYLNHEPHLPLAHIPVMAQEVMIMVRKALDAFVKGSVSLAKEVLVHEDRVDSFNHQNFKLITEDLQEHAKDFQQALTLILISRNLERIGDHATNIAEDVVFAITGEDIRHGFYQNI